MELFEERFGGLAKNIAQNLLLLGHGNVSGLEAIYKSTNTFHTNGESRKHNDTSPVNGVNSKLRSSSVVGQFHLVLAQLLRFGFVERVHERLFLSPTDMQDLVEKRLLRDKFGGQIKGTKQRDELKLNVRQQLKSWREDGRDWQLAGKKRAFSEMNGHGEKQRLSGATVNGNNGFQDNECRLEVNLWLNLAAGQDYMLTSRKPTMVVRINYEKCSVALRNKRLVELAHSRIGKTTSEVFAEVLRLLEQNISRCRVDLAIDDFDDPPDPFVTTMELSLALSKTIRVSEGIGDPSHGATRKSEKSLNGRKASADEGGDSDALSDKNVDMRGNGNMPEVEEDSSDYDDPFDEDVRPLKRTRVTFQEKLPKPKKRAVPPDNREQRSYDLKKHLQLLAQDSCHFIRKCGQGGSNEWSVDFERLVEQLRESEVDTILLENFGPGGLRLVRMLRTLGKVEEKALPNLALMKQKDIRTKMAEMQMAGMVDIQEVPRDAGRSINRTIFLWYFDPQRVCSILLDNVYKAMSRCLQRLEYERRRSGGILAMMERSDVREAEDEGLLNDVLDDAQQGMLREIRSKEDALLGQIARLDELVGIFHDY